MPTFANKLFERFQSWSFLPLLLVGRVLRFVPAAWLWKVERVFCRILGERPSKMLDRSLFYTALLGRGTIQGMDHVQIHFTAPLGMTFDTGEYTQRLNPLFGMDGPLATLPACTDQNSVIFDIGANLGFATLPAAIRLGDARRIHAFEPNPKARGQLIENLKANGVEATVNALALSEQTGVAMLHFDLGSTGHGSLSEKRSLGQKYDVVGGKPPCQVEVSVITLDAYVEGIPIHERQAWGNLLIKMDVEGFELQALRGAMRLLKSEGRPVLLMVETRRQNVEKVAALVRECGFEQVEEIQPRLFRKAQGLPDGPLNDLYFLKNVKSLNKGMFFEWPIPTVG